MLISIQNEREWAAFCDRVLGEPGLARSEGFDSNNARVANRAAVDGRIARVLATMTRAEAADRLKVAGTAYGFVNTLADLVTHPALMRAEVETPAGRASLVAPPVLIDGAIRPLGPVPAIGEHSQRIRGEFTGAR